MKEMSSLFIFTSLKQYNRFYPWFLQDEHTLFLNLYWNQAPPLRAWQASGVRQCRKGHLLQNGWLKHWSPHSQLP